MGFCGRRLGGRLGDHHNWHGQENNAAELLEQALVLPPADRVALAQALIDSLAASASEDMEQLWRDEIHERAADLDSGRVQSIPWAEVQVRLRRRMSLLPVIFHPDAMEEVCRRLVSRARYSCSATISDGL